MALTAINPEVKILDVVVGARKEDGTRPIGVHYAWWDAGRPTRKYFEWSDAETVNPEVTFNTLIEHMNDDYDVAHEA